MGRCNNPKLLDRDMYGYRWTEIVCKVKKICCILLLQNNPCRTRITTSRI
ncbi:Protein of unknown function [Pyronema omphalodes CBS 100304]|uniref:Uncharacterized protein n=1 Tax=Pyronema omphalodes (strain CBS 100304) TaxID=1076935 RepID=U4LC54_PYROM|nr:Protein of unknown function [Pyronema omphalodes CBS 100304]